jgi:hypothetical protein
MSLTTTNAFTCDRCKGGLAPGVDGVWGLKTTLTAPNGNPVDHPLVGSETHYCWDCRMGYAAFVRGEEIPAVVNRAGEVVDSEGRHA